jgi:hypothetical protein
MVHRLRAFGALVVVFIATTMLGLVAGPVPHANAQTCSNTFRDSKQGIVGCITLHAGLVIAHVKSNGTQTFDVDLRTQDPAGKPLTQDPNAYKTYYQLYSVDGRVDGSVAVMLKTDDTYYLSVNSASGPYEFTFEQPTPATVNPVNQTSFTGKAQQVTPVFHLSAGPMTVTVQSDSFALRLWLYQIDDLGGGAVPPAAQPDASAGTLLDVTGGAPSRGTVAVTIPADGLYFFYVDPVGVGSTAWSVAIQ